METRRKSKKSNRRMKKAIGGYIYVLGIYTKNKLCDIETFNTKKEALQAQREILSLNKERKKRGLPPYETYLHRKWISLNKYYVVKY